jgi:hypothetical protein
MDEPADPSTLDVDFAPAVGLVAVSASIKDDRPDPGEASEFATAQQRVLSYLAEHLLKGPASEARDRINALLLDDRYHKLISRAEATVPVMAVEIALDEGEMGMGPEKLKIPPALADRYLLAVRIQFEVISVIVAAMSSVRGRRRRRSRRVTDRLAFMYDPNLPSIVKRAVLGSWVAPMCCLGVLANEGQAEEATLEILLDEWIGSMRHQLALGVALKQIGPLPEDVLPQSFQYSFCEAWGRYLEGLGRTMRKLAALEREAPSQA